MIWLIITPLPFAVLCLALPASLLRRLCLVAGAVAHLVVVSGTWSEPPAPLMQGSLALDPLGHVVITCISVLFAATAVYFVAYHQKALVSQRIFLACILLMLAALSLACISQHLGVMWVALEASTLAATPLIYFRLGARSLEAAWKFLLMNSVGIALALLGILCIALASTALPGSSPLTVGALSQSAAGLDPQWLRAGFLLVLIGFGTKMGLAPLHSWKPDVYGEAPPPVAALLAGGMTLGAFLGLLRVYQICSAAGLGEAIGRWMIAFGLLSILVAGIFILGGRDYRRLLAYTSVEHMGILVLAVGLGSAGAYPGLLHAMHNTLNKGVLFFIAGFLWRMYGTDRTGDIRGVLHRHPVGGLLLLGGMCATLGLPPFGMFYSEIGIAIAAVQHSAWWVVALLLLTLAVVFIGVISAIVPMAMGAPTEPQAGHTAAGHPWGWRRAVMLAPAAALLVLALAISIHPPAGLTQALADAAHQITPGAPAVGQGEAPGTAVATASPGSRSLAAASEGAR